MFLGQYTRDGNLPVRKFSDKKLLSTGLPSEPYELYNTAIFKDKPRISPWRIHEDI